MICVCIFDQTIFIKIEKKTAGNNSRYEIVRDSLQVKKITQIYITKNS
jgi:hypothetical protein